MGLYVMMIILEIQWRTQYNMKFLHQLPHEVVKMKEMCDLMLSLYPKDSYPLEVLGQHYLLLGKENLYMAITYIKQWCRADFHKEYSHKTLKFIWFKQS